MHLERASSGQYHLSLTGEEWRVKTRHAPAWFKRGERGPTIAARPSPAYAASLHDARRMAAKLRALASPGIKQPRSVKPCYGWLAGYCAPGVSGRGFGTRDREHLPEDFAPAALEQILAQVRSGKQKPTLTWGHGGQVLARAPINLTFRLHSLYGLEFMARLPDEPLARRAIEAAAGEGLAISIGFVSKRQRIVNREGVGRVRVIEEAKLDHVAILPPAAKLSPVYAGARCFGQQGSRLACPGELLDRAKHHAWPLLKKQAGVKL
jgi:hypothetical protein